MSGKGRQRSKYISRRIQYSQGIAELYYSDIVIFISFSTCMYVYMYVWNCYVHMYMSLWHRVDQGKQQYGCLIVGEGGVEGKSGQLRRDRDIKTELYYQY